jgi:hypothetical protein
MVTASEGYRGSVNGSEVEAVFIESWDKANVENGTAKNLCTQIRAYMHANNETFQASQLPPIPRPSVGGADL